MRRRSLLRLALLATIAIAQASCLSPTLPLPPPDVNSVVQNADGTWTVAGTCDEGAIVTVLNRTTGLGVVVEDRDRSGHYVVEIAASAGHQGVATQTVAGEVSDGTTFTFIASSASGAGGSAGQ